jgi:hypothetical protein
MHWLKCEILRNEVLTIIAICNGHASLHASASMFLDPGNSKLGVDLTRSMAMLLDLIRSEVEAFSVCGGQMSGFYVIVQNRHSLENIFTTS